MVNAPVEGEGRPFGSSPVNRRRVCGHPGQLGLLGA